MTVRRFRPGGTPLRVLLVNDDKDSLDLYAQIMSPYGIVADTTVNVGDALRLILENRYDVVVTDLIIGVGKGRSKRSGYLTGVDLIDTANSELASRGLPSPRWVMISGHPLDDVRDRFGFSLIENLGVQYLRKPLDVEDLVSALQTS